MDWLTILPAMGVFRLHDIQGLKMSLFIVLFFLAGGGMNVSGHIVLNFRDNCLYFFLKLFRDPLPWS